MVDYADYIEMACEEESGTYRSHPSTCDVLRSGRRFVDPADFPANPLAVTRECHDRLFRKWYDYFRWRSCLFGEWHYLGECPFCKIKITSSEQKSNIDNPYIRSRYLGICMQCGWWESDENDLPTETTGRSIHRRAVLREFSVTGSEVAIDTLQKHIVTHPSALNAISPKNLERLVASVFSDFMNCEAIHIGGPNDEGIDIVLINSERTYVMQVKRRVSPSTAETVSGIREFVGAMLLHGTLKGLYVSTAPKFSPQAQATALKAERLGLVEKIDLIDATRLLEVCRLTVLQVPPPWEKAWSKPEDFIKHIQWGFNKFMELSMGAERWKVVPGH